MSDHAMPRTELATLPVAFSVEANGDRVVVRGELVLATTPELEQSLRELTGDVTLDCHQLDFIDSTGVFGLLRSHDRYTAENRRLCIDGLQARCRRVFDILGVDQSMHLT